MGELRQVKQFVRAERNAAIFALCYIVGASLYIYFSSRIALAVARDAAHLSQLEMIKGIGFMVAIGIGLYAYTLLMLRRIGRDAGSLIQSREALLLAEKRSLAGVLAASVAHDCNNLLTIASLRLDALSAKSAGSEAGVSKEIDSLRAALDRMVQLVRRLKDQGGRAVSKHYEDRDLAALLGESVELVAKHAQLKHCDVSLEAPPEPIVTRLWPELIQQATVNLILNAAEAIEEANVEPGRILVRLLQLEGGKLVIEVHDNGPGVPEKLRYEIFDAFYTTKKEGSGLGLLSVKTCADEHGGTVEMDRSDLLAGACFRIRFQRTRA